MHTRTHRLEIVRRLCVETERLIQVAAPLERLEVGRVQPQGDVTVAQRVHPVVLPRSGRGPVGQQHRLEASPPDCLRHTSSVRKFQAHGSRANRIAPPPHTLQWRSRLRKRHATWSDPRSPPGAHAGGDSGSANMWTRREISVSSDHKESGHLHPRCSLRVEASAVRRTV
jgi:hypothetical protein